MLEKCFEIVCNSIKKNDFLLKNLNSYHLSESSIDEVSYPSITIAQFNQEYNYSINSSILGLKIKFSLIAKFDNYDYLLITEIDKNIKDSISFISFFDENLDVKISLYDVKSSKKDNLWKEEYKLSGMVFFKTRFFN